MAVLSLFSVIFPIYTETTNQKLSLLLSSLVEDFLNILIIIFYIDFVVENTQSA